MNAPTEHKHIADYGLIADGETAALVNRNGTIEWLCLPRFDSDACFAALLGDEEHGCWRMSPTGKIKAKSRRYLGDTMILQTCFETADGRVSVTDFMPIRGQAPDIVRIVEGLEGSVAMHSELGLRFDYGRTHPLVRSRTACEAVGIAGSNAVKLCWDVPIERKERRFRSGFTVRDGDRFCFVMTWFASHLDPPDAVDPMLALDQTRAYWENWISGTCYHGPHRDPVIRSLLTLKALIHTPTGGIVAAPTASLPERRGGNRNWDYRYCWLRDATFTLLALLQAGLRREAEAWVRWLRRAVAGEPIDLQPFYTVSGDRRMFEWEADWLNGFGGAQPVRFGNAAADQLQLDVYGEVLDVLLVAGRNAMQEDGDELVRLLADRLEECWRQPDAGIWESRGEPHQHTYSKIMCWVAFDRASCWFAEKDRTASRRYRQLADQVKHEVLTKGFDAGQNSFVRAFDDKVLDASVLRIPLVGFLPADDPRVKGTVAAIERHLMRNGFVRRYAPDETDDGVGGDEGAFLPASFWLADVYVLQNRHAEAEALFERLCSMANDLGLISEEVDCTNGQLLGNFPQALSHLSLVDTAMNLSAGGGPAHERGRDEPVNPATEVGGP